MKRTKLSFYRVLLVLGVAVGACYATSIGGDFHFDDTHSIVDNISVHSLKNIPKFWTDPKTSSLISDNRVYRPLGHTLYAICWFLGGGETWPFHLMKMGFHFLVCLALFLIWKRLWSIPGWFPLRIPQIRFPLSKYSFSLTPEISALVLALTFAIHPACSECVDYISATSSLQCALFYVWAYYFYLLYRDSGKKVFGAEVFLFYFLSVATKEEGITLPAILLVSELFFQKGGFWERWVDGLKKTIPFALFGLCLGAWIYLMHPVEGNVSRGSLSSMEYFLTQWRAYLWYMRIWFWPWDLNADYATVAFSKSLDDPLVIQAALGNLFLLGTAWAFRKKAPGVLFGLIWFYVTISPASSVVVLAEAINEHRMYLAYIGFVGGAFTILLRFVGKFKFSGGIYAAILLGLAIGTQERNRVWANDENLWADTVEKNPTSGRALNNLALVYIAKGEYRNAIRYLEKCETHWDTYMYCPLNKGISHFALAKLAEIQKNLAEAEVEFKNAEKDLERAYQLDPNSVHTNFNLGRVYEEIRHDYDKAIDLYSTSFRLTGERYTAAKIRLASCYQKQNRFSEAFEALEKALSLEPANELALFEKKRIEFEMSRFLKGYSTDSAKTRRSP